MKQLYLLLFYTLAVGCSQPGYVNGVACKDDVKSKIIFKDKTTSPAITILTLDDGFTYFYDCNCKCRRKLSSSLIEEIVE